MPRRAAPPLFATTVTGVQLPDGVRCIRLPGATTRSPGVDPEPIRPDPIQTGLVRDGKNDRAKILTLP